MIKGSHHTPEAKEKLSKAYKYSPNRCNKGSKHTDATRLKIKEGMARAKARGWKQDTSGLNRDGFNQKHSAESKIKMSKSQTGLKRPNISERNKKWIGELAPNWRGGITKPNQAERGRFRREVQKKVFERDDYKCVLCNSKGTLQVDHIKSWADYPELRFDMDNCRTLCIDCHYLITFGKPKPNGMKAWGHNFSQVGG